jgi:release factor glutamine methyltransferase
MLLMNYTIRDLLTLSTKYLKEKGFEPARLDAELLLAHCLKMRRLDLYLNMDMPVDKKTIDCLRNLLKRRALMEPVAYLVQVKEFYGIEFFVTNAVLIPRPETEVLIDAFLDRYPKDFGGLVLDLGTGSGAIACSIAIHRPKLKVIASDISDEACSVAKTNCLRLGLSERVFVMCMDMFSGLRKKPLFSAVISNPPYVRLDEVSLMDKGVRMFEPQQALFCGEDSFEVTGKIIEMTPQFAIPSGALFLEVGSERHLALIEARIETSRRFGRCERLYDLARRVRGICASLA